MTPLNRGLLGLLLVACAAMTGCGSDSDERAMRDVTARFYAAVRADDGTAACELLSGPTVEQLESQSGQACDDVITRLDVEGGDVRDAAVFARNARVTLSGGESAFLTREPGGWRISALACVPQDGSARDRPMDCEVEA